MNATHVFMVIVLTLLCATPVFAQAGLESLLVIEPTEKYPRHSEGDIVELAGGALALVYTRFTTGSGDFSPADIVVRISNDGGKSWGGDRLLIPNEGQVNVMSVSILRPRSGELLVFYLRKNSWNDLAMYVRRSSNELATLSGPVRVTVNDGYYVVNNDRVVQLSSGRLVVPASLHPCPDGTKKTFSGRGIPRAFLSDDDGRSWRGDATDPTPPTKSDPMLQEPGVLELKDGRLWMWMRTDQGTQYECFSTDGGEHWSKPGPGPLASPRSPATIERLPWTGDFLCVWNDHSGWHVYPKGKRTPLCVAISRDDGRTWGPSRVIEGDPDGWYCYTSMAFIKDRVLLAYCAGDSKVGGLNRLKVVALTRDWLYPPHPKNHK